jgi:hypothetical protein
MGIGDYMCFVNGINAEIEDVQAAAIGAEFAVYRTFDAAAAGLY